MTVLKKNLLDHPSDRETLLALISFSRDAGDLSAALQYAQQLAQSTPDDPSVNSFIESLKRQIDNPSGR